MKVIRFFGDSRLYRTQGCDRDRDDDGWGCLVGIEKLVNVEVKSACRERFRQQLATSPISPKLIQFEIEQKAAT